MQLCISSNPEALVCLTPNVEASQDLLSTQSRKRDVANQLHDIVFRIGLNLDGFDKYNDTNFQEELPEYSEFTFAADPPAVERWDSVKEYKGGDSMTVYGREVSDEVLDETNFYRSQFYNWDVHSICWLVTSKGEDMQRWGAASDYTVTIGLGLCEDMVVNPNSLQCTLPKEEPDPLHNNTGHQEGLEVHVSQIPVQTRLSPTVAWDMFCT